MTPSRRMWRLAFALGKQRMLSTRMLIMLPILLLFIPGMAWGFADPNIQLPAEQLPTNGTEVMFLASIGIVFAGTMAAVLIAHDGISRDRVSGVLEVRLSQPMPRWRQGVVLMVGHWSSIALPLAILKTKDTSCLRGAWICFLQMESIIISWKPAWMVLIEVFQPSVRTLLRSYGQSYRSTFSNAD